MERQHKAEMIRILDTRINTRSFDNRAVLLFGHCNATEEVADYLLTHLIIPFAILDNSVSKQGLTYCGIPITSPEIVRNYCEENSIILIAARFYEEMSAQCRRLGYNGEIIKVTEYNSFAEYSLSTETLERMTERMRRGLKTLEKIRIENPIQHLVICPNKALGDVYWAMSFLPAYQKKHNIRNVVIVVIGEACRQVVEMFSESDVVTLNNMEMDEFVQAIIYTCESNCIVAHHDRPYTDNIIKWLDKHFLSFIDYYRCAVYGLPKDTPPAPPCRCIMFENREQILKDKTVILSPYAKSVVELPNVFWDKYTANYSKNGFDVYTNVVGDEQPIKGTRPLSIPIVQMTAAAEYSGTFISVRNGLCDVVNNANCRKIVLYPDCYYSTTVHKVADFFYLPGWESIICDVGY